MTLPMLASFQAHAQDGLDVAYIVVVHFGGSVGTKYYSNREIRGIATEVKLRDIPAVTRRADPSAVRFDALNDDITIRLLNTPENYLGVYDTARIQDLITQVPLNGAQVDVGIVNVRTPVTLSNVKWDAVYRVDRTERDNEDIILYCLDRMMQPGEKIIGKTINDADWPAAPMESFGKVRGPIFGKVDSLPLVPVEVGLFASLGNEIDDQDGVIELVADSLHLWPNAGYVEIDDEVVYYPSIDRTQKRLGSTASGCIRGSGFPLTTAANHGDNAVVREAYTGRESTLNGAHAANATTLTMRSNTMPTSGVVLIGNEAIRYAGKSGLVLNGLTRGVAVPTLARVHDIGSTVRTIPVDETGKPRYRYVVGQSGNYGVENIRVVDESGNDVPYQGGAGVTSSVARNGRFWSILDLPERPRVEKFESSGSQVPQEWVFETDGRVDAENVALPAAFLRWKASASMSAAHVATWPRAIDPNASTRAVILEATTGKNIFSVLFDGKWDGGLNAPRQRYGRFRNARLRMLVQLDRMTSIKPNYQVHSNGVLTKSGLFPVPSMGGGGGVITGSQTLPSTRWNAQVQQKEIRLGSRFTNAYGNGSVGHWLDPVKTKFNSGGVLTGGLKADHASATDGDTRTFLSGGWNFGPGNVLGGPHVKGTGTIALTGALRLQNIADLPPPWSNDKLQVLQVTINNPVENTGAWTGWDATIFIYQGPDLSGELVRSYNVAIGKNDRVVTRRIDITGLTWYHFQSIMIQVDQYNGVGTQLLGSTVGNIAMSVEYAPDLEGQRVGTIVDGSYFQVTATESPSAIYEQTVSLGQVAKDWARTNGRDPWDYFSNVLGTGEGMKLSISLPTAGDGLRFAVADVFLDLEYDALSVSYDGAVVADVNGRNFEDPVDVLAHLVDSTEFYDLAFARDASSFSATRDLTTQMGWKLARAITEPVTLRDLTASLCAESRLLLLADGLKLFARFRFEEATLAESVRTAGDDLDASLALISDRVKVVNRLEDICNSIGVYYRRNYLTGNFRTVIEEIDTESIRLYGENRATPNLDWHQSSRGYANGFEQQKIAVMRLTKYMIEKASRMWDYATFEVGSSVAEDLQRYDVVTLNWPRSGYYSTPGRVMHVQRMEGPMRWGVTVEIGRATQGYIWRSAVDLRTYIKLAEAGARMDFVIQGQLVAQLTSGGHLRCRGNYTEGGASFVDVTKVDTGAAIHLYRTRDDGSFAGKHERYLSIDAAGNVVLNARDNGVTVTRRQSRAPGVALVQGGAAGIKSPGTVIANSIEFYLANNLVMYINAALLRSQGKIVANLGMRMGSV